MEWYDEYQRRQGLRQKISGYHHQLQKDSAHLRQLLKSLQQNSEAQTFAVNVLSLLTTEDLASQLTPVTEHRRKLSQEFDHLVGIETELARLESTKSSGSIQEAKQALEDLAALQEIIERGIMNCTELSRRSQIHTQALNVLIERERSIIQAGLTQFSEALEGKVQQLQSQPSRTLTAESEKLLALADILYTKESLLEKEARLFNDNEKTTKKFQRLSQEITRNDRNLLANSRAGSLVTDPEILIHRMKQANEIWYVSASLLNLRSRPTASSGVLNVLERGQMVQVTERQGYWWRVKSAKGTGWVGSRYLSK